MNHTSGPWEAGRSDTATQSTVYGKWIYAGDRYLAMASHDDVAPWSETLANAHLIAAAPALLAACQMIIDDLDGESILIVSGRSVDAVKAAIAAALPRSAEPAKGNGSGYREDEQDARG